MSENKSKRVFIAKHKVIDDKGKVTFEDKEFAVLQPTVSLKQEGDVLRETTWNKLFEKGRLLRRQLDDELKRRNLWNERLQSEYDMLQIEVINGMNQLEKGGIKLSEARAIAIDMAKKRQQMVDMLVARSELDNHTCEGQADNARFNFLLANCLVYNDTGEKVYATVEEYVAESNSDVAVKGASEFYYLVSGTESLDDQLPENKFLKQYEFVDDDFRYTERGTGRLISEDGKYIDEEGYYIDYHEDGSTFRVTYDGAKVDLNAASKVEFSPFLDDDGSPVTSEDEEEVKPKPKRKRRTTKKATTANADA